VLRDLNPRTPFDYAELRQRQRNQSFQTLLAHGTPCKSATDVDLCQRALREPASEGFGSACHPGHCDFHVVITDARGVSRLASSAALSDYLGPIDTPGEALLMAFANEHWVLSCDTQLPRKSGAHWALVSNQMVEECPVVTADVALSISTDGVVRVVGTTNKKKTAMCVGRRPPGLREAASESNRSGAVGDFLATSAHLEAASIDAFEYLVAELSRLGAPPWLTRGCKRAAADERRHTEVMTRLAHGFGSKVPKVDVIRPPHPTIEALAIDNAVEGCVRETFGAVVGLYQARHAADPRLCAELEPIARDELDHAELAWQIAHWVEARLEPEARERTQRARKRAIDELRAELGDEPGLELQLNLGLPSAETALEMFAALERTLWAA
jgi:hypothetical protein